uniref:DNA-directed RNA polymerase subunit beta n=1 Tax=Anthurium amnicola TaxID=1678845 RepID=A0A1D1YLP0_9ARAE
MLVFLFQLVLVEIEIEIEREGERMAGAFWGTRVLEIVKKNDSPGLLWKRIKLTTTRKANAKKRLRRVWQNEEVLRACTEPPVKGSVLTTRNGEEVTSDLHSKK